MGLKRMLFFADNQVIIACCKKYGDKMLRQLHKEYDKEGISMNRVNSKGEEGKYQALEFPNRNRVKNRCISSTHYFGPT